MQKEVFPPLHEVVVKALDLRVNQKLDLFDSLDDRTQSGRQDGKGVVGEVDLVLLQKELVVGSLALKRNWKKERPESRNTLRQGCRVLRRCAFPGSSSYLE